jgi:hypothetical protein
MIAGFQPNDWFAGARATATIVLRSIKERLACRHPLASDRISRPRQRGARSGTIRIRVSANIFSETRQVGHLQI